MASGQPPGVLHTFGRRIFAIVAAAVIPLSCEIAGPSEPSAAAYEIISPSRIGADGRLPVVALRLDGRDSVDLAYSSTARLVELDGGFASADLTVRHGVASTTLMLPEPGDVVLSIAGDPVRRTVAFDSGRPVDEVGGSLTDEAVSWNADADVHVTADLLVPAGHSLTIGPDTRVLLAPRVNVIVEGSLVIRGERVRPILFTSASAAEPWGGVVVVGGTLEAEYAFFVNAGGDESRAFSHSGSQAVLKFETAEGSLQHVFLMDNVGKGIGGERSVISFDRGLITRSDTGGEVHHSVTSITNSHILEIPNADGSFVDDDNDGFYFFEAHPDLETYSRVERTFILVGKDDAVDHNHARLEINGSWLEGFMHECVAGSSGNEVRIYNSVLKGCEQGVEAGYGAPTVVVDHSVITGNEVGVRYGDSYAEVLEGHITVTNSILSGNADDVLNLDRRIGGPAEGAISISHSILNDPEYEDCSGCIQGAPSLDDRFLLEPGSIGLDAATDGSDIGLVRGLWE